MVCGQLCGYELSITRVVNQPIRTSELINIPCENVQKEAQLQDNCINPLRKAFVFSSLQLKLLLEMKDPNT